jgi:hypothetical protein
MAEFAWLLHALQTSLSLALIAHAKCFLLIQLQMDFVARELHYPKVLIMKRAEGLSMNVIIVAAIALLVLVVVSVIFLTNMAPWGPATKKCENNGGKCVPAGANGACPDNKVPLALYDASCTGQICCAK